MPEGETVAVGTVIAVIAAPGDDIAVVRIRRAPHRRRDRLDEQRRRPAAPARAQPRAQSRRRRQLSAAALGGPSGRRRVPRQPPRPPAPVSASHRSRGESPPRWASTCAAVRGSGPDGRIVRRDIEEAAKAPRTAAPSAATPPRTAPAAPARATAAATPETQMPAPGTVVDVPLSRMRQTIARRMAQSKRDAPHYYLTVDVDMTEAIRMRAQINDALGETGRVSINDLLILACTRALERHPRFNSWWLEDHLQLHGRVNVDIAIALDDGLIAPAVLDCQAKPLAQIAREARDLAERARSGAALTAEEYTAGTFTITNLGAFGVDSLIGIINPPQTAILGVGAYKSAPPCSTARSPSAR